MLPYKYVIIIYMLPLTLDKILDEVLTMNNKKMCLSALDAMLSVVQAGEQHRVLPLLKLSKHVFRTRGTLYSSCHNCNNNRGVHYKTAVNVVKHCCRTNPLFRTAYSICNYYFAKSLTTSFSLPLLPPCSSCYLLLIFLHRVTGSKAAQARGSKIIATTVNLRMFTGGSAPGKREPAKRNPRNSTGLDQDQFYWQRGMFFEKRSIITPSSRICKSNSGCGNHNQSLKSPHVTGGQKYYLLFPKRHRQVFCSFSYRRKNPH